MSICPTDITAMETLSKLIPGALVAVCGVTWHGGRRYRWLKADAKTAIVSMSAPDNSVPQPQQ
ncbi:MAG: hypothetical protein ACRCWW_08275 [Scandinavium sp.]|uniref:hypothetical protein n=1 Tax=Scandinavium sp. TaxID=2830653 RepID=UPI003F3E0144